MPPSSTLETLRSTSSSIISLLFTPRVLASLTVIYPLLVHLLRHRRLHKLIATHNTTTTTTNMTFYTAQAIVRQLAQLEFPFTFEKSLQFALFRTYGIPSISSLLLRTSLFSSPETASKRYADTAVLIADFLTGDWGTERWRESIARVNCIHAPYREQGSITNADMLYTLSLFACELPRWCKRFEWRQLSHVELCALGVVWKGIGDAFEISYADLPSNETSGWRDGAHWIEEVRAWALRYEESHMVPHAANHEVAEQTTAILLWSVPHFAKPTARHAVYALMDARLRAAMQYPDPSRVVSSVVLGALQVRRYFLRHLALPRVIPWRSVTSEKSAHGTYYMLGYESVPYYVKPTLWNRWLSPGAIVWRLRGLPVPGDEGVKYHPEGYSAKKAGPPHGMGRQKVMEEKLEVLGGMQCPMAFQR